jgi:hypothetical protein
MTEAGVRINPISSELLANGIKLAKTHLDTHRLLTSHSYIVISKEEMPPVIEI